MNVIPFSDIRLSKLFFGILFLLQLQACSKSNTVNPPVFWNNLKSTLIISAETEPSGMTGDREIFKVWQLEGTSDSIELATSHNIVIDRLTWTGEKETYKLSAVLAWFEELNDPEFNKISDKLHDVLKDPNLKYAYEDVIITDSQIRSAALWICSPSKKLLIFLAKH